MSYSFGPYLLDVGERRLLRGDEPVALPPKVFDLLAALVRRQGRLARKEELLAEVWPDTYVTEASLTQSVWLLRRALGDDGEGWIETVPRAGYRFAGPIVVAPPTAGPPAAETSPEPATAPRSSPNRWMFPLGVVLGLVLIAAVALRWVERPSVAERPVDPRPAVAGAPFRNLAGDRELAWLSAALPELLAAELAGGGKLRAVSTDERRTESHDPRELGRRLGARYMLTGSYLVVARPAGREVRMDARLVDVETGEELATVTRVAPAARLIDLVAESGSRLRAALHLQPLAPFDSTLWLTALPRAAEARRLYIEGLARLRSYDLLGAAGQLERATAIEPELPLAHTALALARRTLSLSAGARAASSRALELRGSLPRETQLLVEGEAHLAHDELEPAVEAFQALYSLHPEELERGMRLAAVLTQADRSPEALAVVERLRALPPPARDDPRLDITEAFAALDVRELRRSVAMADRAATKLRSGGSPFLLGRALKVGGDARIGLGDSNGARATLEEARAVLRAAGDGLWAAHCEISLAALADHAGDTAAARGRYERALQLYFQAGNRRAASTALYNLGLLESKQGRLRRAAERYGRALALKREVGDRQGEGRVLNSMAALQLGLGDLARAQSSFEEALRLRRESQHAPGIARSLQSLAWVALERGEPGAEVRLAEAAAICQTLDDAYCTMVDRHYTAEALLRRGEAARALATGRDALGLAEKAGLEDEAAEVRLTLASALLAAGDLEAAFREADSASRHYAATKRPDDAAIADALAVRALAAMGRYPAARERLREAQQRVAGREDVRGGLSVGYAEGVLQLAAGEPHAARRTLEAVAVAADRAGMRFLASKVRGRLPQSPPSSRPR